MNRAHVGQFYRNRGELMIGHCCFSCHNRQKAEGYSGVSTDVCVVCGHRGEGRDIVVQVKHWGLLKPVLDSSVPAV